MSAAGQAKRNALDFYKTPEYSIKSLLERLDCQPDAVAFEPCLGHKDIADFIPCNNIYYCELQEGVSYLSGKTLPEVDLIITNPPYTYAQEFIDRSFEHCRGVIAYLLRVNFLGSQKRRIWWQTHLPTHLYVLSERPSFNGISTDATEYAWYVWDKGMSPLAKMKDVPGIYVI